MGGVLRKTGSFCGEMYLTKENPYTNVERRTGSPGFGRARRTKKTRRMERLCVGFAVLQAERRMAGKN